METLLDPQVASLLHIRPDELMELLNATIIPTTSKAGATTSRTDLGTHGDGPAHVLAPLKDKEARQAHRRRRRALAERRRVHGRQTRIKTMIQKVQELQQYYERLCDLVDQARSAANAASTTSDSAARSSGLCPAFSFVEMAREIHRLHEENTYLRDTLEQKAHFEHMIQCLTSDLYVSMPSPNDVMLKMQPDMYDIGGYCYIPFTPEQCYAIVRHDLAQHVFQRSDLLYGKSNTRQQLPFGWKGFFEVTDDHKVQFQQTKVWPVHPDEAFDVTWKLLNIPSKYRQDSPKPQSVEILQRISNDILVVRRITKNVHNDCVMHWVLLLYRMRLGDSYVVAYVPLPLHGNGSTVFREDPYGKSFLREQESFMLVQFHCIYEAVPVVATTEHGSDSRTTTEVQSQSQKVTTHTRIHRWGTYACETAQDALFWSSEIVDVLLRFEYLIVSRSSAGRFWC